MITIMCTFVKGFLIRLYQFIMHFWEKKNKEQKKITSRKKFKTKQKEYKLNCRQDDHCHSLISI